jgi:hypothetical protein
MLSISCRIAAYLNDRGLSVATELPKLTDQYGPSGYVATEAALNAVALAILALAS